MGFDPYYNRQRTKGDVKRALRQLELQSYTIWELIGEHDFMLEAWLPTNVDVPTLQKNIRDQLPHINSDMLTMTVDQVIQHWMWDPEIDLGQAEAVSDSRHYSQLNGPGRTISRSVLAKYEQSNLIRKASRTNTIKFFLRITNPPKPTNEETHEQVVQRARAALGHSAIKSPVLMRVRGDGGSYLLTGRVKPADLEQITLALGESLGQDGFLEQLRCRTTTHLSALRCPIDRREQLLPEIADAPDVGPTADTLRSWLLQAEGDILEFKASAFTDVDDALGLRPAGQRRSKDVQCVEVAKAVCGMLNASGGHVVVGVAELDRYVLDALERVFGEPVVVGARALIGVEYEYPDKTGWDAYQRQVAGKLRKTLSSGVDAWLKYHPVEVEGRTVCVIEVRRPTRWYYLRETKGGPEIFYGRTGGSTMPLSGRNVDDFQDAHPRTTRGPRDV